jgi:hypothetical protein
MQQKPPDRLRIIAALTEKEIPAVMIGAQAMRFHGSSRESLDIDFAVRTVDVDAILELMYPLGYRLPIAVSPGGSRAVWAPAAEEAAACIEREKRGALNLYFLDASGAPVDQVDFVYDYPVPFAMLLARSLVVRENPELRCASVGDLVLMKESRLAQGQGGPADEADLAFLKKLRG